MKLDLYFATRFLRLIAIVTAIFFVLILLIESLEQIREFSKYDLGLTGVLGMTLLRAPTVLYQIMPMIVVISALTFYLALARSSELVVARAAGRSAIRHMLAPVVVSFGTGLLCIMILNPLATASQKQYELRTSQITQGLSQAISISEDGLWLREGNAVGQRVVHAKQSNQNATVLRGISIMGFTDGALPAYRIEAETARIIGEEWRLTNAKRWPLLASNPEAASEEFETLTLPTTLSLTDIRDSVTQTATINLWDLRGHIAKLEAAGFSARTFQMQLHAQLALPLVFLAMLMIAAVFSMRHTRLGGTSVSVFLAIVVAFSFFFLLGFTEVLAQNGKLPVLMAAWVPPVTLIFASLALLLHLEDG